VRGEESGGEEKEKRFTDGRRPIREGKKLASLGRGSESDAPELKKGSRSAKVREKRFQVMWGKGGTI